MTDTKPNRPSLSEFTRPSKRRPQDHNAPSPSAPSKSSHGETDTVSDNTLPPETPEEQEAHDRMRLYEQIQDTTSPVKDYKEYLAKLNISEEEAARIVDDMLTKGFYEETFKLSKTRFCTLRTREHRDTMRLQMALEVQRPIFQDSSNEMQTRYNMAASLAAYNGEEYYFPTPTDSQEKIDKLFDERMRMVECLPAPIFSAISLLLAKFDQKILAVLRPGVAENF